LLLNFDSHGKEIKAVDSFKMTWVYNEPKRVLAPFSPDLGFIWRLSSAPLKAYRAFAVISGAMIAVDKGNNFYNN
jgi:hypothetical protein